MHDDEVAAHLQKMMELALHLPRRTITEVTREVFLRAACKYVPRAIEQHSAEHAAALSSLDGVPPSEAVQRARSLVNGYLERRKAILAAKPAIGFHAPGWNEHELGDQVVEAIQMGFELEDELSGEGGLRLAVWTGCLAAQKDIREEFEWQERLLRSKIS